MTAIGGFTTSTQLLDRLFNPFEQGAAGQESTRSRRTQNEAAVATDQAIAQPDQTESNASENSENPTVADFDLSRRLLSGIRNLRQKRSEAISATGLVETLDQKNQKAALLLDNAVQAARDAAEEAARAGSPLNSALAETFRSLISELEALAEGDDEARSLFKEGLRKTLTSPEKNEDPLLLETEPLIDVLSRSFESGDSDLDTFLEAVEAGRSLIAENSNQFQAVRDALNQQLETLSSQIDETRDGSPSTELDQEFFNQTISLILGNPRQAVEAQANLDPRTLIQNL